MSLYGDKQDYAKIINNNIQKAKLLFSLSEEDQVLVESLLNEKEKVKEENGLFANLKLKKLDKKIEKMQKKYKNS